MVERTPGSGLMSRLLVSFCGRGTVSVEEEYRCLTAVGPLLLLQMLAKIFAA
jgi:hypothetical protein